MMLKIYFLIGLLWMRAVSVTTLNVLIFLPLSSKSYKNTFDPLAEELAKRNHSVTFISMYPASSNISKLTNIELKYDKAYPEVVAPVANDNNLINILNRGIFTENVCHMILNNARLATFLGQPQSFDVVLTNPNFNECYFRLVYSFSDVVILVSPSPIMMEVAWNLNIPTPVAYVPHFFMPFISKMTLWERFWNTISFVSFRITTLYAEMKANDILIMYYPDVPSIYDAWRNVSLILVNSHSSMEDIRPIMPYMLEVGGMHCRPAKQLPKEFEDFVQGSGEHGFVVFSLGTVIHSGSLPANFIENFKIAFSHIKQRVVWKSDTPIEGVSSNVLVSKWIPQQDLMGHAKCRLAITHGGTLSLQEVVYHSMPLLGIPFGVDRDGNLLRATIKGFALTISRYDLSADTIVDTINELVYNESYKENAEKISFEFRDRPETAVNTAAYWVEYAVRHKGAKYLKSGAENLNVFQYFLLDVIGIFLLILFLVLYVSFYICRNLFSFLLHSIKKTKSD